MDDWQTQNKSHTLHSTSSKLMTILWLTTKLRIWKLTFKN